MKAKCVAAIFATALALTLTAASCNPDATGTVVHKWLTAKPLIFTLVIRQPDGSKVKVYVHRPAWRHCHIGDRYPECSH
jgi:hypothetical protein